MLRPDTIPGLAGTPGRPLRAVFVFLGVSFSKQARFAPFATFGLFAILVNERVTLSPLCGLMGLVCCGRSDEALAVERNARLRQLPLLVDRQNAFDS